MIDIDAVVDKRDVENRLRRLQLAGKDLRVVFRKARRAMREDQTQHAVAQRGSEGAWPALARSTYEHRRQRTRKQGRPRKRPLKTREVRKLGKLPRAYKIVIAPNAISVVPRPKWWRVHQMGGTAGHRSRIPKREFHWASGALLSTVARLAMEYLREAWEK